MAQGKRYLTFPVWLLQGACEDIRAVTDNIMNYCGYVQAGKETGTQEERMTEAGHYCGLTWGNWKSVYNKGQKLAEQTPAHSPMTSINKDIVFDFYKNEKTVFEIVSFLAFAAIRSVIQTKPYAKITNEYLLARMAGRNTTKDFTDLPETLKKYCNRYQLDKVKTELQNNWGLMLYARYTRGFYVTFDGKMKYEDLVFKVEQKRKSNIEKMRKDEQQQAVKKALDKLFKTTP